MGMGSLLSLMAHKCSRALYSVSPTIILGGHPETTPPTPQRPPPAPLEGKVNFIFIFSIAPDHKISNLMLPLL